MFIKINIIFQVGPNSTPMVVDQAIVASWVVADTSYVAAISMLQAKGHILGLPTIADTQVIDIQGSQWFEDSLLDIVVIDSIMVVEEP